MSAATADRATKQRGNGVRLNVGLAVQKVYAGVIAMINTSGYALMGAATATQKVLGVFDRQVDNSGGSAGDLSADILTGEFYLANSASADEITIADVGKVVYVVDNQTVAKTSSLGTRPVAGICTGVDANGVWVDIRPGIQDDAFFVQLNAKDLTSASALVYEGVAPKAFDIEYFLSVLEGGALATGDATLTMKIGATAVTGGVITITQSGSAAGDVDSAIPTALKSGAAGARINATVGGTNTAARAAQIVAVCKPQ